MNINMRIMTTMTNDNTIHEAVRNHYAALAEGGSCCDDSCCAPSAGASPTIDVSLDSLYGNLYTADTSWLPQEVTGLSLGCGDPITLAGLQPGQTVLDLGSGGGIDCFMAARQVGPGGHVIGVDMTPAMLAKAERNKARVGLDNIEFRQGFIEALPVADGSVDVILSNCVINLSPDKPAVFREAYRVLRPGGRLVVELLDQERVDRADSTWWFSDDKGLWGDRPFLNLGERRWDADARASIERYTTIDLATGGLSEIVLCDQTYAAGEMIALMQAAGFGSVSAHARWAGLPLYDAEEWVVYVASTPVIAADLV